VSAYYLLLLLYSVNKQSIGEINSLKTISLPFINHLDNYQKLKKTYTARCFKLNQVTHKLKAQKLIY